MPPAVNEQPGGRRRGIPLQEYWGKVHKSVGNSPLLCGLIGLMCLFFGIVAMTIDITTTEYLALGVSGKATLFGWSVWAQPLQFFTGGIPAEEMSAYAYAWIVETIQLVFGLVITVALIKLTTVSVRLAKWFAVIGVCLIIMNIIATFSVAPANNPLIQALIAVAIALFAVVGVPTGLGLCEHAIEEAF